MFAGTVMAALATASPQSDAAVLIADDFDNVANGANINGRFAPTNSGKPWIATTTSILGNGSGGLSGNSANASVALVDLGSGYLSTNPGVYSVSVDINQPSGVGSSSWLAVGFAQTATTTENFVSNNGAPWLLFRLNGSEVIFGGPSNAVQLLSPTTTLGVNHTFRIDLDTSTTNWTLNTFLDGVQQDLNGASTGNTFTYTTNPTASRYVGLSTGVNGTAAIGTFDNFQVTGPLPEPSASIAALLGVGAMALRRSRRVAH